MSGDLRISLFFKLVLVFFVSVMLIAGLYIIRFLLDWDDLGLVLFGSLSSECKASW
jgi:hypothetical protein